jgi:hypothetical protein
VKQLLVICCLAAVIATGGGCGKKRGGPASQVAGLSAVPASAEVVVAVDVPRVASSPLVTRAVDSLLLKNSVLAAEWQRLSESCKTDPHKLESIVFAIGPGTGQPGTGPVLMVVTGKQLVETELAECVRSMVGQGGGTLTAKPLDGRTLYQAKDGQRTMFFAFGKPDTVVMSANEDFVKAALGPGKKLSDNSELTRWMARADQKAPIWAAGRADPRVRTGLVKLTNGQLKEGPVAIVLAVDMTNGAKLDLGAVMASAADAKALESFGKTQLGLLSMAAQAKGLGMVVQKVSITAENDVTRLKANLDVNDVNLLISVLDGTAPTEQDSPPSTVPDAGTSPDAK